MDVVMPGWLVTYGGKPHLLTHWYFGPNQQRVDWDELAAAYPDRVITLDEWSSRERLPGVGNGVSCGPDCPDPAVGPGEIHL